MAAVVRSMTGSGAFVHTTPRGRFEAEARSVNHRHLKVTLRVQGALPDLAAEVEERVRLRLTRGHVTLGLAYTAAPGARAGRRIDRPAFLAAAADLREAALAAGLPPITASDVLAVPGVLAAGPEAAEETAPLLEDALSAVDGALVALEASRAREGTALARECERLLASIAQATSSLEQRAAEVPAALAARLTQRLADLLGPTSAGLEPTVLAREVALLAEKSDVREELTRLAAHVAHARQLLAEGGALGRPFDFLAQELGREANTVGSKANDLALTRTVIALKADVERLREQVQNLE